VKYIILISILWWTISCSPDKTVVVNPSISILSPDSIDVGQAITLIQTHCYTCHSPSAPEKQGRIAPPLVAVKAHYLQQDSSREAFISAITSFLQHPSTEKAVMKGALTRFGLMPAQQYPAKSIALMAAFMYDYQIEEPSWFAEHWKEMNNDVWLQKGRPLPLQVKAPSDSELALSYAMAAKKQLGKNLMEKIQKQGTDKALQFCNLHALSLTDSVAQSVNASIRRVTDKPRNLKNLANKEELKLIEKYKANMTTESEAVGQLSYQNDSVYYYYPIVTNTMCLQCHGSKEQIVKPTMAAIHQLYPKDKAIGYKENEVRGIWSVKFKKLK
jgi:cytochrome c553